MLACIDTLGLAGVHSKNRPALAIQLPWWLGDSIVAPAAACSWQMRAIRAALSQKSANQRDQAQGAALKPVARRPPAPVALTGMFDPSKIGQRQNASARVVAWAKDLLPDTVEASA